MSPAVLMHKKYDQQIVYMRFLAIILIILHHSTTIYTVWPPSSLTTLGLPRAVGVISSLAKLYGLGLFTFISGFLLALGGKSTIDKKFIWHKTKRILFPCAIAALIYYLFFMRFANNGDPVNGTHLWYLPMIFVFYFLAPLINGNNSSKFIIGTLIFFILSIILSKITDIRTFSECFHYIGIFIGGSIFYKFVERVPNIKMGWILSIIVVVLLIQLKDIFSSIGCVALMCCLYYLLKGIKLEMNLPHRKSLSILNKVVTLISNKSFFIYLVHQFVINLCIMLIPYDIPYFKVVMTLTCFLMSIIVPLLLDLAIQKVEMHVLP